MLRAVGAWLISRYRESVFLTDCLCFPLGLAAYGLFWEFMLSFGCFFRHFCPEVGWTVNWGLNWTVERRGPFFFVHLIFLQTSFSEDYLRWRAIGLWDNFFFFPFEGCTSVHLNPAHVDCVLLAKTIGHIAMYYFWKVCVRLLLNKNLSPCDSFVNV